MDCLFLEPFLYLYYQLPIVADRSGPIPTNVWPPPPSVDVLFHRQRTEFLSKRVFYPWGGQIPRYATDLGNVIYEQNCLPLWVPKPKVNMYHALESLHNMAEQPAPLSSILSTPRYNIDDASTTLTEHSDSLGHCHIGTQLAEALMDEIAVLPDLSMSSDRQFAFFADHSGFGKTLDIQPFVRGWLGNGAAPGLSPWSPCYTNTDNLLIDGALDTIVDLSDPELPSTPATPALDMIDNPLTSSITSTSTNLMTPRSEVDLFAEAAQNTKASGLPSDHQYRQEDSDGESDELIVIPRLWNSSIPDLNGDPLRRPSPTWSPPPVHLRSYDDDGSSEAVHSPVQSILNWRDGTTRSRYVASSTNVACPASECTIVPAAAEISSIENITGADERTLPGESSLEDPVDEESRNDDYEVILPEATVVQVDKSTSRWLYGILREQDDDDEGARGSIDLPSSTSSLGSELSSLCPIRLAPRAAPLWGPPPSFKSTKDDHASRLSLIASIQDMDDSPSSHPSHTQRRLPYSQPPSTMHEEILTWVASPEVFNLPNNCRTEPDPALPSGKQRKRSWFNRLLNKAKRGPRIIQRMLPIARWLSVPSKVPLRGNRNKRP